MNYRAFHIAQTTFYLLVIVVLCFMIPRPYHELDTAFQATFERMEKQSAIEIKESFSKLSPFLHSKTDSQSVVRFCNEMIYTNELTSRIISKIKDRKLTNAAMDSLQSEIENYMTLMIGLLPSGDSLAFRACFSQSVMLGLYLMKGENGKWLRNLLKGQSPKSKAMLLSLVRSNIYHINAMVNRRLSELGRPSGCYWDTACVLNFTKKYYFNIGDTLRSNLAITTLPHRTQVDYFFDNKLLHYSDRLANFCCTAGMVGEYYVQGYLRFWTYETDRFDTLPWSFQNRVIGKGISIANDANQTCFRKISNPISVSIPGYPADKIKLRAKGAKLVNNNNGKWTITVADENSKTIIVYADATDCRGHTSTVHAVKFAVHDLTQPLLTIDGEEATMLTTDKLNSVHTLDAKYADDDWPNYTVTQYEICMISAAGKHLGTFTVNGNQLGKGTIAAEAWNQLSAGARIYLTDIIARTSEGAVVSPKATGLLVM